MKKADTQSSPPISASYPCLSTLAEVSHLFPLRMLNHKIQLRVIRLQGGATAKRQKGIWIIKRPWINLSRDNSRPAKTSQTSLKDQVISPSITTKANLIKDTERRDQIRDKSTMSRSIKTTTLPQEMRISNKYSKRRLTKRKRARMKIKICNISLKIKDMWKPRQKPNIRRR